MTSLCFGIQHPDVLMYDLNDVLNVGWHCTESKAGDRGGEEQGTGQDEAELDKGTPLLTS